MTELIYCADGNKRFAGIALRYGLTYGAQLPNKVHHAVAFADQNWKKPDRRAYMDALKEHRPRLATVLDYERAEQLNEVISWAWEASQFVSEAVIIIPKVMNDIDRIPHTIAGKQVRLGYSVPTRFAGTEVPLWQFGNRPVHLLGGSPQKQHALARYLNAVSADGNYLQKVAIQNMFFCASRPTWSSNGIYPKLEDSPLGKIEQDSIYVTFELSVMNLKALWLNAPCLVRFAVESDLQAVKKIANQYKDELGYVMLPALRESLARKTLIVAEQNGFVVGFVNYRACRDGWQTVYEIAVDKRHAGQHIGAALLACVPKPIRLKTTVDNEAARAFYARQGFCEVERETGRKRELVVLRCE